jgi:hypothetical protein
MKSAALETLHSWIADEDADEDWKPALQALADQIAGDLATAAGTEASILAPVAELLKVEPETFAVVGAVQKLLEVKRQADAARSAHQEKVMAAKAKVAVAIERRAQARKRISDALALLRQADTDIEVSDLTDEQIKERSS